MLECQRATRRFPALIVAKALVADPRAAARAAMAKIPRRDSSQTAVQPGRGVTVRRPAADQPCRVWPVTAMTPSSRVAAGPKVAEAPPEMGRVAPQEWAAEAAQSVPVQAPAMPGRPRPVATRPASRTPFFLVHAVQPGTPPHPDQSAARWAPFPPVAVPTAVQGLLARNSAARRSTAEGGRSAARALRSGVPEVAEQGQPAEGWPAV